MFKKFTIFCLACLLVTTLSGCISFGGDKEATTEAKLAVFASPDKGSTWQQIAALMTPGEKVGSIAGVNVLSMATDLNDSEALYIGTRANGIFYSYNGGAGWNRAGNLLDVVKNKVYSLSVDPDNKCIVYAGIGHQIFKTEDCSRTWKDTFTADNPDEVIRSIVIDWYDPNFVYAAARDGSVYRSENKGESWKLLTDVNKDVRELVLDSFDSRIMYLVTRASGIYRSADSGNTWVSMYDYFDTLDKDTEKQIKATKDDRDNWYLEEFGKDTRDGFGLESPRDQENVVYYLSEFGLLKSEDRGLTWKKVELLTGTGETEFFVFRVDPQNSKNIYIGDDTTLYRTTDGGSTWETLSLPTTHQISTLEINVKDSNILYTGYKTIEE